MLRYEKKSLINTSQKMLYDFHLDVKNIQNITPKDISLRVLNEEFVPHLGGVLRLRSVKHFLPMVWEVRIDAMDEPHLLVDVALRSPFASWKHSHIFTQVNQTQCELKDVVEYSLPFGFIGRLFDGFVDAELEKMFAFRHEITKEILEDTR